MSAAAPRVAIATGCKRAQPRADQQMTRNGFGLLPGMLAASMLLGAPGATSAQVHPVSIAGYLPDAQPLPAADPRSIVAGLLANDRTRVRRDDDAGVVDLEDVGDPSVHYVVVGKAHWAYPSVIRLRRAAQDGFWATRIGYACGAAPEACARLEETLRARQAQIVFLDDQVAASEGVRASLRPWPKTARPGRDFWIRQFSLNPRLDEVDWRDRKWRIQPVDPRCEIVGPAYASAPDYPAREYFGHVEGTAVVVFTVAADGHVLDAQFEQSTGAYDLDFAALDAVSVMRFRMKGCATPQSVARARVPFVFDSAASDDGLPQDFDRAAFGY